MSVPAGPSIPPILQTMRWVARPIALMQASRERYGEAFSLRFAGFKTPMVMVSNPDLVKATYSNPSNALPQGRISLLEPVLGKKSVILLEGKEHMARRKLMLPAFHGERMRSYEDAMREAILAEIEGWPIGKPFPIHPRMQAVTLEVIMRTVFGVVEGERHDRLRHLLSRTLEDTAAAGWQVLNLFTRRFGGPTGPPGFDDLLARLNSELSALIAERRADASIEERTDILSMMACAEFPDGGRMDEAELRDQLMTLLVAGHETTATALAWTFDLVLRDRRVRGILADELAEGGDEYLRATITESLRLRPVIPIAGRILDEAVEVDGLRLEAGTNLAPSIWMAHTRADSFPDPFAFRPERFLGKSPDTYSWIPYGGGVRRCLGAAFAEFEMRVVLTEVLKRCRLRAAGKDAQRIGRRNITLSPEDGTPVIMEAAPALT